MTREAKASRTWAAFLLSPILPCLAYFTPGFGISALPIVVPALPIIYALMLVFAMPAYFILKASNLLKPLIVIAFASIISIIPEMLIELVNTLDNDGGSFRTASCEVFIDGKRTACGYIILLKRIGLTALCGTTSGAIFCMIYFKRFDIWKKPFWTNP